jgi:hypothetical protein
MRLKLGVLPVLLIAMAAGHVQAGGGIKAAAAKVDITPPLPATIWGSWLVGHRRIRRSPVTSSASRSRR